jgi:class 3 adenylate cyclase
MRQGKIAKRTLPKIRLGQLSVRTKLIIVMLVVSFCSVIASTYICSSAGQGILAEKVFNQLTSVRATHAQQFQQYSKLLVDHVETLSENTMFINAMKEFKQGFDKLATVNVPKAYDNKLQQFYSQEFIPRLKKTTEAAPQPETFLPKAAAVRYIQYHYIANNPYPIGEKHKLADAKDGSEYSRYKARYTANFHNIVDRFGYYDMFLIDMQGNIVYTLFNEVDLATNLLANPAEENNLSLAFRDCRQSNSKGFVKIVDFQPYLRSYNTPSAFVAAPIFEGAQMIGVLAFQMPTSRINDIFNHAQKWREHGLGETGEIYLVGQDMLSRTDSRFLIENPDKFTQTLRNTGLPEATLKKIREFKTTILLQPNQSEGIKMALQNKTVLLRNTDYRGVEVLGAYAPIEFAGLQWAIAAKMDVAEAFASISRFERKVMLVASLIMVIVTLVAMWIARIFVKPIERLIATTQQVEADGEKAMVVSGTRDEFHDLAKEFNKTLYTLRSQIREREQRLAESDALITKLLPLPIAKRLKAKEGVIADSIPNVTVMFTDLHRFTRLSPTLSSDQIVLLLDELAHAFDDLVERYGLEKIKTIGDGYLAVCGLSMPHLDSQKRTIDCALEMIAQVRRFSYERKLDLDLRVGINTGEVVAGTVGKTRYAYDIWGETVNIAYRLKSAAPPGGILVSANIYDRLVNLYEFESSRPIAEPNKEALEAWLLPSERKVVTGDDAPGRRGSSRTTTTGRSEVNSVDQVRNEPGSVSQSASRTGKQAQGSLSNKLPETSNEQVSNTPLPRWRKDALKQQLSLWQRLWKR